VSEANEPQAQLGAGCLTARLDGMPRDRDDLQRMLNAAYIKGREDALRGENMLKKLMQQNCEHSWKLAQIAGEGRYCAKCGLHDYDFDD
jgi:hypothetical protein